jgi:hypothetical protein
VEKEEEDQELEQEEEKKRRTLFRRLRRLATCTADNDIVLLIFDIENPSSQLFVIYCEIDDTGILLHPISCTIFFFFLIYLDAPSSGLGHQLVSAPLSTQRY